MAQVTGRTGKDVAWRYTEVNTPLTAGALLAAIDAREQRHGQQTITYGNLREIVREAVEPMDWSAETLPPVAPGRVKREFPKVMERLGKDNQVVQTETVNSLSEQSTLMRGASVRGERWYAKLG